MRELLREYMDYSDIQTVHQLSLLTEANQNQFLVSLTSKLYDKIREKATKIDFSSVEISRGDITKIQNYSSMIECLNLMRRIIVEFKQDPAVVDEVLKADQNLRDRVRLFKKAFAIGSSLPILVYDTTALALVEATSFLITVCIEYVKDPAMETVQMAVDAAAYNKTRQNLLFTTLQEFNKSCADKSLDNALNLVMSQAVVNREAADMEDQTTTNIEKDHPFLSDEEIESGKVSVVHDCDKKVVKEGIASSIGGVLSYTGTKIMLWICKKFIPIIRGIVYYYYYNRQVKSEYYADQADMLQMNALAIQANSTINPAERKKIYDKQMKLAEKYRARANRLDIDYTLAKKNAEKLANDEAKKFKAEEVQDDNNINYASIFEAEMNNDLGELIFESPFEVASLDDRLDYFKDRY